MINCIIIDDEQHAIELIRRYCEKLNYVHVLGEFISPLEAIPMLKTNDVDVVFLDINMQGTTGIDFMKLYKIPNVILVTAHPEYAIESYTYAVIDYLLKPFSFERFLLAIEKVLDAQTKSTKQLSSVTPSTPFMIKVDRDKYVSLVLSEIIFIEGCGNYVNIYTEKEVIMVLRTLKDVIGMLPEDKFVRVHKSHIIAWEFLDAVEGNRIRLKGIEEEILIGNAYRSGFMRALKKNVIG